MNSRRELVLVADDDGDIVSFIAVNLEIEGYEVITAGDGEEALRLVDERHPDLVLLDIMMPLLDGYEVCQRLRAGMSTRHLPIIMLTAKSLSADKVVGLTAGADDYMIKPFDPVELVVRVKSTLRRSREMKAVNPLTQLPGNVEIQEEIASRIERGMELAIMYIDLDYFKAFNDHYGFARGDEAIKRLAACALEAVEAVDQDRGFLGHVGGDDLIALTWPDSAEEVAKRIIDAWDRAILELADPEDAERGYIEVSDRQDRLHRFPIATVSIGIVTSRHRPFQSHWEAAEIATEMKHVAKKTSGSSYAIDRRRKPAAKDAPSSPG